MGILDSIFDFAGSPKGIMSILAAFASANDRERDRPPTGGGVSYGMGAPRRLQAVKGLGRYTDVMGLANGGTTDEEEARKTLLYGIAQGPYGPLLAYDIPELNLTPPAPKPEEPRATKPTTATIDDYGYEYSPPTGPVGTYNQQINDFLTNLAASQAVTGSGRGFSAAGQYLAGSLANALGREKTAEEIAATPVESRQGTPAGQVGTRGYDEYEGSLGFGPRGGDSGYGAGTVGYDAGDMAHDQGIASWGGGSAVGPDYAQGGHVNMEDGGFVLTERAVKGAGGPRGLAAVLPHARMIRGPGTGTSDSIPATIKGPRGQTPARVSNGEAYVPRRAVQAAGGPKQVYGLMSALERRA